MVTTAVTKEAEAAAAEKAAAEKAAAEKAAVEPGGSTEHYMRDHAMHLPPILQGRRGVTVGFPCNQSMLCIEVKYP